ncbi:MAG TPA: glucans biosynthesis glucosyltransferase MdoH [Pseudomonadales bacterium]
MQELAPLRAVPAEEPLSMPRAPLHGPRQRCKERYDRARRWRLLLARSYIVLATLGLGSYGCYEMYQVVSSVGPTGLQWLFLVLFGMNFLWISAAFNQSLVGFCRLMWRRHRAPPPVEDRLPTRTAILIPVYNEDAARIAAGVRAITPHLATAAPGKFAVFVLSDSTSPDAWVREEQVFRALHRDAPAACPFYYRHRADNVERKAGNVADWVQRWGGGYEAMVVLDADSLMAPETLLTLARRLAADPGVGLIQTLPSLVRGRTLFARLQQFASACYGPVHAEGLAGWYGASGNYWGHNAVIRVRAFAAACHLPKLSGRPPFGGHILSHDFAEAALMRRAGWGVEFHTDLDQTYEEAPPSLLEALVRDRRWCQGNLQHSRLLAARGLRLPSRLHLLTGIMSYASAMIWLLLIVVGLALSVQAGLLEPEYFNGPSLFPHWPVFEAERALTLLTVSMGVLLGPKLLGWLRVMLTPDCRRGFGGAGAVTAGVVAETLLSALYAPVMMLSHTVTILQILFGRDGGWKPQRRDGDTLPWRVHWRGTWPQVVVGGLTAGISWYLSTHLFLWLLPFTTGLVLAPLLSRLSGSSAAGLKLSRWRLLVTPQEADPPAIVRWFEACLERVRVPAFAGALRQLALDRNLRLWHTAQLSANGATLVSASAADNGGDPIDVDHVVALAKVSHSDGDLDKLCPWLTTRQTLALLHDPVYLLGLDETEPAAPVAAQN